MNAQETVDRFFNLFPEYKSVYNAHMNDYGELLQHATICYTTIESMVINSRISQPKSKNSRNIRIPTIKQKIPVPANIQNIKRLSQ